MINFDVDQYGWGAQKLFDDGTLTGAWDSREYVIHYGGNASFGAVIPGDPESEMRALRIYEQSHLSRGWRAIAYNYAVGNSGLIYRLRGENPGGATKGANEYTTAILWIGGLGQEPTAEAEVAMAEIINDVPMPVFPHSHYRATNCPGTYWREWIDNFVVDNGDTGDLMPEAQWYQMIDALFEGRPDEFQGDPEYWKHQVPTDSGEWTDFWAAFVRAISLDTGNTPGGY